MVWRAGKSEAGGQGTEPGEKEVLGGKRERNKNEKNRKKQCQGKTRHGREGGRGSDRAENVETSSRGEDGEGPGGRGRNPSQKAASEAGYTLIKSPQKTFALLHE